MGYLLPFSIGAAVAVFLLAGLFGWIIRKVSGRRMTVFAYSFATLLAVGLYTLGGANGRPLAFLNDSLVYPLVAVPLCALALWRERRGGAPK